MIKDGLLTFAVVWRISANRRKQKDCFLWKNMHQIISRNWENSSSMLHFNLGSYEYFTILESNIRPLFIFIIVRKTVVQLSWNYYYFVQNLYFDNKTKNLWTVQIWRHSATVARVRSQYEVTRAEQDSAQSLATYTDLNEHLLSSSSQCSWLKKLNLDWGIWNLKLRAKFKLFKYFSFYCRSTILEPSSSSFNLAVHYSTGKPVTQKLWSFIHFLTNTNKTLQSQVQSCVVIGG